MSTSAKQEVKAVIAETVSDVARDPNSPLTPREAVPVAEELDRRLGPWILNLTNNEPWYASKIVWGALIAGAGTVARPIAGDFFTAEQATQWAESLSTIGQFVGIGLVLYGRLSTRKSISS